MKRRWTENNLNEMGNAPSTKQDTAQHGNSLRDLVWLDQNLPKGSQFKPIMVKSKPIQGDFLKKEAKEKDVKSLRLEVERIVSEINVRNEKLSHILMNLSEMENAM